VYTLSFLITILAGIAIGIFYDFFSLTRNYGRRTPFKCNISDILFWIIVGIVVIIALYISNDMVIRFYQFLGIFIGMFIYFLLFSGFFVFIDRKILSFFTFIFKILFTIVNYFVIIFLKILKFLLNPFRNLNRFISRCINQIIINSKKNWKYIKRM
jgi:spore cortex biosynthesis protein YabQ